jgi:hypothetical protein
LCKAFVACGGEAGGPVNFSSSSPTQLASFPPRFAKATLKKYSNPLVMFSGSDSISNRFNRSAPNRNAARTLAKLPNETDRPKLFVSDSGSKMCKCFAPIARRRNGTFLPFPMFNKTFASGRESGPYDFKIVSTKVSSNKGSSSASSSSFSSLSSSLFLFLFFSLLLLLLNSLTETLSNFSTGTSPKMVTACVSHGKSDTYSKNILKTSNGVAISLFFVLVASDFDSFLLNLLKAQMIKVFNAYVDNNAYGAPNIRDS